MNIYCFSTLSFAKLQFKSVINKAFHKHGVASFTDAWIETLLLSLHHQSHVSRIFYRCVDWNRDISCKYRRVWRSHLLQMRGLKQATYPYVPPPNVASFTDAWIETALRLPRWGSALSHLLQMRGLKPLFKGAFERVFNVASFTGTTFIVNSGRFL